MANRSNRVEVPEAKAAMDRFKTEVASELGVNLKEGYNGDLTSKEAGSIGGEMVRRMTLLDILDSFSGFVIDAAYKDVKNIQQFYDDKRVFNIAGKNRASIRLPRC